MKRFNALKFAVIAAGLMASISSYAVDIGQGAVGADSSSVAVGSGIDQKGSTAGTFGTAVGGSEWGWGPDMTARMNIAGDYGSAYGFASQAQGRGDTAIGAYANTGAPSPNGATDDSQNSYRTAVGYKASATGEAAAAFGSFSNASGDGSVAIGFGSVATASNVVSVGAVGSERKVTNVAAGTMATDAVNYGQLSGAQSALQSQIADIVTSGTVGDNAAHAAAVEAQQAQTMATSETNRAMSAEQVLGSSINAMGQQTLQSANSYTDSRVNALQSSFDSFKQDTYGGLAAAIAVAGLPQPTAPGRSMIAASASTYHGQEGFAVGVSHVTANDHWVIKASVTTSTRNDVGAVVGVGRQF